MEQTNTGWLCYYDGKGCRQIVVFHKESIFASSCDSCEMYKGGEIIYCPPENVDFARDWAINHGVEFVCEVSTKLFD